ncbi:hypothetical protein SELR_pSRC200780 (plasmid) [Selenomonas ruminantium subsp. lactilytica TAM6421]|uniref:Uncharacterized protein n=1 Tax=Selenomonas ruminantium subsp. lactilytica (strain NBRC 103574 / TAM6421) TaxID=927704 RepID=I0GV25_SELRL|nr:hypothetical protein SELR_pSRC200780 [Selenomonas ruminantium subsp. lactilytica TAM6421]
MVKLPRGYRIRNLNKEICTGIEFPWTVKKIERPELTLRGM